MSSNPLTLGELIFFAAIYWTQTVHKFDSQLLHGGGGKKDEMPFNYPLGSPILRIVTPS